MNTFIQYVFRPDCWDTLPLQGAVCLCSAALLLREKRIRSLIAASAAILLTSTAAAGFAMLGGSSVWAAAGCLLGGFLLRRKRNPRSIWNIEILAEKDGVFDRFTALIDTGNRLTEHRSALPVLIAEEQAIPSLSLLLETMKPDQIRTLPFGVLGSSGSLRCFYPDKLFILSHDGSKLPAPPCWIAVFNGKIPGFTRALAPPEFAEYTQNHSFFDHAIADTVRRISYAFFNR